jgi:hypothetical protein
MNTRQFALLAVLALPLPLAACPGTTPVTPAAVSTDVMQAAFAAMETYAVTARAAAALAPALSPAQRADLKALDNKAYAAVVLIKQQAATGAAIAADVTAATQSVAALQALVKQLGG